MNYLCYDENTGQITETGIVDEDYLEKLLARGLPTLLLDDTVDYRYNKIDVVAKTVVPLTAEELTPPPLPPPSVVSPPESLPPQS